MTSGSTQDLILDGAELSHPITIKRGKTTRTYQVIAYPTPITRKTTNMYADGTVTPDPRAIKKCRWYTAGIIRFHVNAETNSIYESRPDMHELEVTLECLLDESHKQLLAKRAEEIYGLEFTSENFVICPFQTFIAQLAININGQMKTFYGTLSDNTELHPMRIIFNIKDKNELAEIASKLDYPKDNDIILQYDYSLSGTSTARASLTVSAEELSRIDLEKQIFGSSKAQSMVVSRSFMDQVTGSIAVKLKVVEDIGVGGSSFGHDIIKQEIANAISTTGFQKFNIDDLKKLEANDTEITEDLKANIITSTSASDASSSQSAKYTLDKESSSDSSDTLHEKSNETRRAGGQSSSSSNSESKKGGGKIGYGGFSLDLSGEKSTSSSHSASSNFDNADSSASTDHEKFSESSSQLKERDDKNASSNSTSRQVQGQIRLAKDIEASIIHRNQISKGFTISLERWHHQIATTSIKGRLLTKTDADILDDSQIEKAKQEAIRRDRGLSGKPKILPVNRGKPDKIAHPLSDEPPLENTSSSHLSQIFKNNTHLYGEFRNEIDTSLLAFSMQETLCTTTGLKLKKLRKFNCSCLSYSKQQKVSDKN
ncbi:unnamed protein product [Rotaria magnacalcarata]|uniref:Uncharacterized protein n=1 Tax=Rotaria magnacalcarata TaxID=392030 RepID=A0A8S2KHW8_9BILA|nr:unnamed protein product [Rotaria magnacalcarata]CAF3843838.1 unnamed protein product [Rotaria magnacalcarata]CAF3852607.1 unnamed protein product [Rotaria magnacalcarata]